MGEVAKFLLVLTSLAPGMAVYGFASLAMRGSAVDISVWLPLATSVILTVFCILILRFAATRLPRFSVEVSGLKSADSEIVGFALAYILPVITAGTAEVNPRLMLLAFVSLAALVWGANAYHTNPLLSIFRYHFYEVTSKDGLTFVVLSKRTLRQARSLDSVAFITDYMALDLKE